MARSIEIRGSKELRAPPPCGVGWWGEGGSYLKSYGNLLIFLGSATQFQDPPPGFTFSTLESSGTLSHFTGSDDVKYRRIGRNMLPYLVKNYTEGLNKLRNG